MRGARLALISGSEESARRCDRYRPYWKAFGELKLRPAPGRLTCRTASSTWTGGWHWLSRTDSGMNYMAPVENRGFPFGRSFVAGDPGSCAFLTIYGCYW